MYRMAKFMYKLKRYINMEKARHDHLLPLIGDYVTGEETEDIGDYETGQEAEEIFYDCVELAEKLTEEQLHLFDLRLQDDSSSTSIDEGSSSSIEDTFNCSICMEAVNLKELFDINPCNHIFCTSCMIQYLTVKTEENAVPIPCPTPGCETRFIDPSTCQDILPVDTLNTWSLALYELSLGQKRFYCPYKDCSAMLVDEGGEAGENLTDCMCPHCQRVFCARCKVPWHDKISCEEFARLGDDEKGREDLMLKDLAKKKRWQRCPKCRMYVEKTEGCTYMKCRCGHSFCYGCGSLMSDDPRHYCEKCNRTW